jgi:hypothetical protein
MSNKILSIWTNLNGTAKIVLAVAVVVVAGMAYKSCASDKAMDRWRHKYDEFRAAAAAATHHADSLQVVANAALARADTADAHAAILTVHITERDSTIAKLKQQATVVHGANDSTFASLTHGQPESTVVAQNPGSAAWIHITFRLREENDLLRVTNDMLSVQVVELQQRDSLRLTSIMELKKSVASLQERGDSLQVIVSSIPTAPPREKFLFIPLPSRKMSLFVGVGLGVVGSALVNKYMVK